jgi:hypothetical protein
LRIAEGIVTHEIVVFHPDYKYEKK